MRSRFSIRGKIFLWQLCLILGCILTVSFFSYYVLARPLLQCRRQHLEYLAENLASRITEHLDDQRSSLLEIARGKAVEMYAINFEEGLLQQHLARHSTSFPYLAYINAEGREEVHTIFGRIEESGRDVSSRPVLGQARRNPNQVVVGAPVFSDMLQTLVIPFAIQRTAYFGDRFIGLLLGEVPLSTLIEKAGIEPVGSGRIYRLLDSGGTVLYSTRPEETMQQLAVTGSEAERLVHGISAGIPDFGRVTLAGQDSFVAHIPLTGPGWNAVVSWNAADFLSATRTLRNSILLLLAALVLLILTLSYLLAGSIIRPLRELVRASQEVARGNFSGQISFRSYEELRELEDAFNTMTRELARIMERERRLAREKLQMEQKLNQARKMEAIGLMASGVAHDLNNILSGIVSYPELILMKLPQDSPVRKDLIAISQSGLRASEVVADLLTVARGTANAKKTVDLNMVVREYIDSPEYRRQKERYPKVRLELDLAGEPLLLFCSVIHIRKCLMNLVVNALEAVSTGTVTITTGRFSADSSPPGCDAMTPGEYAMLQVSDTGPGMDEETRRHIFEPFFSKKKLGRSGTGLGLTIVWNTVQEHDGCVTVTSGDRGTTFTVYLPLTLHAAQGDQELLSTDAIRGHGETILVVDDEPMQRDIADKMLTQLGYRVTTLASGEEAVEYLRKHEADLLLLDMLMGDGLSGTETYARIVSHRPGQRALIISGYAEDRHLHRVLELGAGGFLKKPYTISELGQAVRSVLTGQGQPPGTAAGRTGKNRA
ncbi:MAG TPA: response regulator [Desulfobulbus sp.]|nr:response regulator [Desulfobulbus sp.]